MPCANRVQQGHVVRGRGEHGDEVVQTVEVEFADGAGLALLDQEAMTALGAEAAHDLELGVAEAEAVDVFLVDRLRVGQEDFW